MPPVVIAAGVSAAANMAYDSFVARPEREGAARRQVDIAREGMTASQIAADKQNALIEKQNKMTEDDLAFRRTQYEESKAREVEGIAKRDRAFADYKSNLDALPKNLGNAEAIIKANMAKLEAGVKQDIATQRPQILENLATRGVRTSGISEYPLTQLQVAGQNKLEQGRQDLTIQQILAEQEYQKNLQNMYNQYNMAKTGMGIPGAGAVPTFTGLNTNFAAPNNNALIQALTNQSNTGLYNTMNQGKILNDLVGALSSYYANQSPAQPEYTSVAPSPLSPNLSLTGNILTGQPAVYGVGQPAGIGSQTR